MSTLHIFNPSHDECLAQDSEHYCPKAVARRLEDTLHDLPRLWAHPGDSTLHLPMSGRIEEIYPPNWKEIDHIAPWGWDRRIVHLLKGIGAPATLLPEEKELAAIRQLSSRSTVGLVAACAEWEIPIPGCLRPVSCFCLNVDAMQTAVSHWHGHVVLKRPWSSSGRGVLILNGQLSDAARRFAEKSLREQGGIEVQPRLENCGDGALEFNINASGNAEFLGYSLFHTSYGGAYGGNWVLPQSEMETAFLDQQKGTHRRMNRADLHLLTERLSRTLSEVIGKQYVGPLGVDVLFTPDGLYPLIEINLRRTMGHVALSCAARLKDNAMPRWLRIDTNGFSLVTS